MKSMTWVVLALCVVAVVAAVVSFTAGDWPLGIVWILIAGLGSNLALFQVRRSRRASA
ncbi:hypothetical protein [Mangrovactinospora gilvigrisea]|uniref:hypothetical protein n=1 Tax=Mangrovactinospora gilvigrisea TaxID=1428644 RepID=UPI000AD4F121|nr:hypothetical protein [Mangrovactinospora gilvigrisea]